jgi:hypothetical protein
MNYYLYRHIRLDKNQPFYIGIGTVYSKDENQTADDKYYRRAYCKYRSNLWDKISKKTDYKIQIIFESNDYSLIKSKEVEFIKLYGRLNNNTGILVNLTDGGEGVINQVVSNQTKEKIRKKATGRKWSDEYKEIFKLRKLGKKHTLSHIEKAAKSKCKPIIQYSIDGVLIKEWESSKKASSELGLSSGNLCCTLKGIQNSCGGYLWRYKEKQYAK